MADEEKKKLDVSTSASGDATEISVRVPAGTAASLQGRYTVEGLQGPVTTTLPPLDLDEVRELYRELGQVIEHAEATPKRWK